MVASAPIPSNTGGSAREVARESSGSKSSTKGVIAASERTELTESPAAGTSLGISGCSGAGGAKDVATSRLRDAITVAGHQPPKCRPEWRETSDTARQGHLLIVVAGGISQRRSSGFYRPSQCARCSTQSPDSTCRATGGRADRPARLSQSTLLSSKARLTGVAYALRRYVTTEYGLRTARTDSCCLPGIESVQYPGTPAGRPVGARHAHPLRVEEGWLTTGSRRPWRRRTRSRRALVCRRLTWSSVVPTTTLHRPWSIRTSLTCGSATRVLRVDAHESVLAPLLLEGWTAGSAPGGCRSRCAVGRSPLGLRIADLAAADEPCDAPTRPGWSRPERLSGPAGFPRSG